MARLQKSWREAADQADRQTAAALTLSEDIFRATGYGVCALCACAGLVFGGIFGSVAGAILCAFAGGVIGLVVGVLVNLLILCLIYLVPAPFARLARRR